MLHVYLFLLCLPLLFFLDPLYRKLISFLTSAAATIVRSKESTDVGVVVSRTKYESSNGGSVDVDVSSSSTADHLVILVHGILGCAANWKYVANQFVRTLPDKVTIHSSESNMFRLTLDGVDVMGERLAAEVIEVVNRRPEVKRISFVAHSVGGLVSRYAIGRLYRPPRQNAEDNPSGVDNDGNSKGTICGLEPVNFITFASPHLGSRGNGQVPFLFGVPAIEKVASYISHWIFGRTGTQLFLVDDIGQGKPPLLLQMVEDCGELHFMSGLQSFKRRVAYSNVGYDHIVGWRTSSIRRQSELPKWEESITGKYPHVVYEEFSKGDAAETSANVSLEVVNGDTIEGKEASDCPPKIIVGKGGCKLP
ncbi:putative lipase [Iris pallida]|uniref:Lipase n=1 Tax=Iris pallida TaxID=29817 RepID=A0AAX6DGZ5_IRIPA|nr:putative lipase [Iris pallida]